MNSNRSCICPAVSTLVALAALTVGTSPAFAQDAAPAGQSADRPIETRQALARLDRLRVREVSGVVASRKAPGLFWAHGDSGNESKIVAFDSTGRIVAEVSVLDAPNADWEDICADDAGHLYIADIGDGRRSPVRRIYKIEEPDPRNPPDAPIRCLTRYEFRCPRAKDFDLESLFYHQGNLYVLHKNRWSTVLYRVDHSGTGLAELRPVVALPVFLATAADVSADGKRLVISSYMGLWVFPLNDTEDLVDTSAPKYVGYQTASRIEGCCFAGRDLILAGEDGLVFRVTADDVEAQAQLTIRPPRPQALDSGGDTGGSAPQ